MFDNLTYKKKNLLLAIAAVFLLLIIYSMGIRKTMDAKQEYELTKTKLELGKNAPLNTALLENKLKELDARLGDVDVKEEYSTESLLTLVTHFCKQHHVVLKDFPPKNTAKQGELTIITNQLLLAGKFTDLLRLVYLLEQKANIGKVTSVRYQLKKDIRTREMQLTAMIYVQNIKKQNND